jgi:hypothetical protein
MPKTKEKSSVSCTDQDFATLLQKYQNTTTALILETEKFYKEGVKRAAGGARKYAQELKKMAQDLRIMIQARKVSGK